MHNRGNDGFSNCIFGNEPKLGMFLSPDPVLQQPGNPLNYNRYSYVLNNPLRYTDPSGYQYMPQYPKHEGGPTYQNPSLIQLLGGGGGRTGQYNSGGAESSGYGGAGYGWNGDGANGYYYDWYSGTYRYSSGVETSWENVRGSMNLGVMSSGAKRIGSLSGTVNLVGNLLKKISNSILNLLSPALDPWGSKSNVNGFVTVDGPIIGYFLPDDDEVLSVATEASALTTVINPVGTISNTEQSNNYATKVLQENIVELPSRYVSLSIDHNIVLNKGTGQLTITSGKDGTIKEVSNGSITLGVNNVYFLLGNSYFGTGFNSQGDILIKLATPVLFEHNTEFTFSINRQLVNGAAIIGVYALTRNYFPIQVVPAINFK